MRANRSRLMEEKADIDKVWQRLARRQGPCDISTNRGRDPPKQKCLGDTVGSNTGLWVLVGARNFVCAPVAFSGEKQPTGIRLSPDLIRIAPCDSPRPNATRRRPFS